MLIRTLVDRGWVRADPTGTRYSIGIQATHESGQYPRPFSRVGRRLPAFATATGKALLAEQLRGHGEPGLTAHLPATLTPLTPHTVVDSVELRAQLAEAQMRGHAVDREENVTGVICVAVALHFGGASWTPSGARYRWHACTRGGRRRSCGRCRRPGTPWN